MATRRSATITAYGVSLQAFNCHMRRCFSTQSYSNNGSVWFVDFESQRQNHLLKSPSKEFPLPGGVSSHLGFNAPNPKRLDVKKYCGSTSMKDFLFMAEQKNDKELVNIAERKMRENISLGVADVSKKNLQLTAMDCPRLLKRDLSEFFPNRKFTDDAKITVLNVSQKTDHDMSAWSHKMEAERESLTTNFIESAGSICARLHKFDFWADFIDPSSGRPYLGEFTSATLFEVDERYTQLGYKIEDLGCCKVVKHALWGTHAFVGTIFTNAPITSDVISQILDTVNSSR